MHYVVDASVAVKWLFPEVHSSEAELRLSRDVTLSAPDLLYAEIGNVLRKQVVGGDIADDQAGEALRRLSLLEIDIAPADVLVGDALAIACAHRRSLYDSLYLALAEQQDCALVTADKRLHNAMRDTPFAGRRVWIADTGA